MKKLVSALLVLLMVYAGMSKAQPAFQRSIEEVINPDGTLKQSVQESFRVEGYHLRTGKNGEPVFVPQTENTTDGAWDTQFGISNSITGIVYALATDGNGQVYVGGSFTQAGSVSARNVARYNPQTNTWSTLGTGSSNGVNGRVEAIAIDANGTVYVGGEFTEAGGITANRVARYTPQTNTWNRLGTAASNGVNSTVWALAVDASGTVYVGGGFTQAGGVNVRNVARYNPQTNQWAILGNTVSNGVNGFVYALATDGSGRIYIGGEFTQAGTISANNVAIFIPLGTIWNALGTGSSNGVSGASPFVSTIRIDGSGRAYVGGEFTQAGGTSANNVARYNPQTNSWSTLGTGSSNGVSSTVFALENGASGTVYVGGNFTQAGNVSTNRVARYNPQTNTWTALGTQSNNGVNGKVEALTATSTGTVYVGGEFTQAGGSTSNNFARYLPPLPPSATSTQTVSANGLFAFPPTGVSISFTGVSGSGTCTVERYDAPATNLIFASIPPTYTSQYRFVITASGFTFTSAQLRFNRTQIPNSGITNASSVRVYRRPTAGTGAFNILPNAYNSSFPDEVRATTTAFSEFILGSDDNSNQLPVELIEFIGRKTAEGVALTWRTASELNNSGFEVERKSNGGTWNTLGFVRGAGTTTEAQSYSFLDRTASGTVQYRLKQIDFDGRFEYSNVIEVDAGLPKQFVLAQNYPNPFNPTTIISYQLPVASTVNLKVYDVLGKEVMTLVNGQQEAGAYNLTLNAVNLSSGIYFYRFQAGSFVDTKKMIVIK